jgi:hypothetical protein
MSFGKMSFGKVSFSKMSGHPYPSLYFVPRNLHHCTAYSMYAV